MLLDAVSFAEDLHGAIPVFAEFMPFPAAAHA